MSKFSLFITCSWGSFKHHYDTKNKSPIKNMNVPKKAWLVLGVLSIQVNITKKTVCANILAIKLSVIHKYKYIKIIIVIVIIIYLNVFNNK